MVRGREFEVVSVAGSDESAKALLGGTCSLDRLQRWLDYGEDWGGWRFIPAGSYAFEPDDLRWTPSDLRPAGGPDDWDPEDMLLAPLIADGVVIGMLSLDAPLDGRRPDREKRDFLTPYASEAARALSAALDAERAAAQQQDLDELHALDQYRQQFVDTMTHELRNPLSALRGHLELLDDLGARTPVTEEVFLAAGRSAERIGSIISDLLDLSRVSDRRPRVRAGADLNEIAHSTCDELAGAARARSVDLTVETSVRAATVLGDAAELRLVLTNLASNAIKYSRPGGRVDLGISVAQDHVVVTCADQGIGIAGSDMERLFDEFFRSGDPEARAQVGTGLGLAVVQRVVRRHDGEIGVTSVLGQGTTFTVSLPLHRVVSAA